MQSLLRLLANCHGRRQREPNIGHPERSPKFTVNPQPDSSLLTTHLTDCHNPPSHVTVSLPPELLIVVASYLRNNFVAKGLLTFSLVCRDWRDIARPFIFDSLTVKNVAQEVELSEFLLAHPVQAKWVLSLTYSGPWQAYRTYRAEQLDAWEAWFGDRPKLYGLLPNLVALTFCHFRTSTKTSKASFLQEIGRGFSSVRKLAVENCTGHPDDFTAIISNFDKLDTLTLSRITPFNMDRNPATSCDLSRLTTLNIEFPGVGIGSIISRFNSLQSVRNLQLGWEFLHSPWNSTTEDYLNILSQENVRIDSLTLCFVPRTLAWKSNVDVQTIAKFSRAFELPSFRATHTLTFVSVPIRAISTMLTILAARDSNIRRVGIALSDKDQLLLEADTLAEEVPRPGNNC
ncbi:hypothetical protein NLI96_g4717 [Meripilus lineatus]|uniref:F-box domain-containing protein n=1 Tax=Meripilus lineatus TaxID=2056292 RepID=A0AAD5V698_9APHY|nr:hypothetical protein NLI96_g4717 [Physisporinus lineatus]